MRVEPGLISHPKFIRLKKRVGDIAAEVLIRLWGHCQESQRGEFWPGADAEYVELVCAWHGQPGILYRSLVESGSVKTEGEGVRIHDWNAMNSGFIENWKNGQKGGRPRKTSREPVDNQLVTQSVTSQEPNGNHLASQSDQTRQDLTKQNSEGGSKGEDHVEKPEAPKPPGLRWDLAKELVDHLNQQTGGAFLASSAVLDAVANRLLETKQDVPGVKQMITRQAAIWGKDERMRPFLRPLTLFDEQKFHDYYGQRALPLPDKKAASDPALRRKQLEELIEKSPANRESAYHRADVSDADKQKLRGWRRELAAL